MGNSSSYSKSFNLGNEVENINENGWTIFDGTSKIDNKLITIFRYKNKNDVTSDSCAEHVFNYTKKLRHPYLINFIDGGILNKEIFIGTEKVFPLMKYIKEVKRHESKENIELCILWGIYCLSKGLIFINNDCNLIHGRMCPKSIYVTKYGDWKIGGYELIGEKTSRLKDYSTLIENKYKSPERLENNWSMMNEEPNHCIDIWGLGCIIYECFNNIVNDANELLNIKNVPKSLHKLYKSLLSSDPLKRMSPSDIINLSSIRNNKIIQRLIYLEELHIKTIADKINYFSTLKQDINNIPKSLQLKFLHEMSLLFKIQSNSNMNNKVNNDVSINQINSLHTTLLEPIFMICKNVDDEDFNNYVLDLLIDLFSSNNRGVRINLLQNINLYITRMDDDLVNNKLFDKICSGFSDNVPLLRELTIKSIVVFASKLNSKNLNSKLITYLQRLQNDKEPAIRTNTIVCLNMIFKYFTDETKQLILTNMFVKSMNDKFYHTRIAGIKGITTNIKLLKNDQIIAKLLPTICLSLNDSSPDVRKISFDCMKNIIPYLEKLSDERAIQQKKEEEEAKQLQMQKNINEVSNNDTNNNNNNNSNTYFKQATSWAVNSIATRWSNDNMNNTNDNNDSNNVNNSTTNTNTTTNVNINTNATIKKDTDQRRKEMERRREEARKKRELRKLKREEDKNINKISSMKLVSKKKDINIDDNIATSAWDDDDDDFFNNVTKDTNKKTTTNTTDKSNTLKKSDSTDDFFAKVFNENKP